MMSNYKRTNGRARVCMACRGHTKVAHTHMCICRTMQTIQFAMGKNGTQTYMYTYSHTQLQLAKSFTHTKPLSNAKYVHFSNYDSDIIYALKYKL